MSHNDPVWSVVEETNTILWLLNRECTTTKLVLRSNCGDPNKTDPRCCKYSWLFGRSANLDMAYLKANGEN